jgi:hypothetical protein
MTVRATAPPAMARPAITGSVMTRSTGGGPDPAGDNDTKMGH